MLRSRGVFAGSASGQAPTSGSKSGSIDTAAIQGAIDAKRERMGVQDRLLLACATAFMLSSMDKGGCNKPNRFPGHSCVSFSYSLQLFILRAACPVLCMRATARNA